MKLHAYRLKNYRRLRNVVIELDKEISIFVGANNSGKTSAAQGLYMMIASNKSRFQLFDFSAPLWAELDRIGDMTTGDADMPETLPCITLDLWFRVAPQDLATAMPLLPSSEWEGKYVGMRVAFEAVSAYDTVQRFRALRDSANAAARESQASDAGYRPWPQTLTKYLTKELANEYVLKYYSLDEQHFENFQEIDPAYQPLQLPKDPGGAGLLKSLLRVDFLRAQRHLDDPESDSARAESLSRRLSRFYQRNLDKRADDHDMLRALDTSEKKLDEHLKNVFHSTLERLAHLSYPGVHNPSIQIRASLNPTTVLSQDAKVHYALPGDPAAQLPDSYNGLGYKNLIYMVVELLDLHERWKEDEVHRPPLHLIFIEEPEAHLHAQVQQVFIRNVLDLLKENDYDDGFFATQMVVTTHSPHILYERGFSPIRYFRRVNEERSHHTEVKNLSSFKASGNEKEGREFLQRYLKLTHCDLFFSDAAILVEGNVERLLMPAMIQTSAERLRSSALTILEVGGAFAHRFKELIEFIGLTTLVITDIDSVLPKGDVEDGDTEDDDLKTFDVDDSGEGDTDGKKRKKGSTCFAHEPGAVTANQTLISWLPKKHTIAELFDVADGAKIMELPGGNGVCVRVVYQVKTPVTVGGATEDLCGRTLEEAFGLENAEWSQKKENKSVGLKLKKAPATPTELAKGLHTRVTGGSFDKTRFALEVLASGPEENWKVPRYIADGLVWLQGEVSHEDEAEAAVATASATIGPETNATSPDTEAEGNAGHE